MRRSWDRFAQSDPAFYIDPTLGDGVSLEELVAGGRDLVEWVMSWVGDGVGRERMLEIGCGVGRTAVHFAAHFERVDGIDVSPGMIELAHSLGPPPNVALSVGSGADLRPFGDASFDFVFSHLVFQHVTDEGLIGDYLAEIARVLAAGGTALLQFDTRPARHWAVPLGALPDRLLPRRRRRHVRRYPRRASRLRELSAAGGLAVVEERGEHGPQHWLAMRRCVPPSCSDRARQ